MRLVDEPETPFQINIVPMIDVIFAILTFFIMSTLTLTRSEGLGVNLPQAKTVAPQQSARVTITVDAQEKLFLNRQPVVMDKLGGAIRALIPSEQTALVVINADQGVNHGLVVQVMDQVRQVEGAKLAIAAQKP